MHGLSLRRWGLLLVGSNGGQGLPILVDGQSTSLVKRLAMIANIIDIQIFVSEDTDVCTCPLYVDQTFSPRLSMMMPCVRNNGTEKQKLRVVQIHKMPPSRRC